MYANLTTCFLFIKTSKKKKKYNFNKTETSTSKLIINPVRKKSYEINYPSYKRCAGRKKIYNDEIGLCKTKNNLDDEHRILINKSSIYVEKNKILGRYTWQRWQIKITI